MGKFIKSRLFPIAAVLALIVLAMAVLARNPELAAREHTLSTLEVFAIISIVAMLVVTLTYVFFRKQLKRLEHLSSTDGLTGLFSSTEVSRFLRYDIERSRRYKSDLSVILLKIDNFDALLEQYGFKAGDTLLFRISNLLLNGVKYMNKEIKEFHGIRTSDVAFRYHDEAKILIILPQTPVKGAFIAAERIREAVMFTPVHYDKSEETIAVTISSAVVSFHADVDTRESMMKRAELLLSKAGIVKNNVAMENSVGKEFTPYDIDVATNPEPVN